VQESQGTEGNVSSVSDQPCFEGRYHVFSFPFDLVQIHPAPTSFRFCCMNASHHIAHLCSSWYKGLQWCVHEKQQQQDPCLGNLELISVLSQVSASCYFTYLLLMSNICEHLDWDLPAFIICLFLFKFSRVSNLNIPGIFA
jgi:hypothetical protein